MEAIYHNNNNITASNNNYNTVIYDNRRSNSIDKTKGPSPRLGAQTPTRIEWADGEGSYPPSPKS